ncbi:hypothetical protein TNCV_3580151 [Trichonephila clavipes]|nr:hypothetical protein TNCV_3580151 [Trichonephila clavipes]
MFDKIVIIWIRDFLECALDRISKQINFVLSAIMKNKSTEGRCSLSLSLCKIIQAHLKQNRIVITRELGDGGNIGDCHTFADGQVDHRVSQVLVEVRRFQWSIKSETSAVAKSYCVTYILLGYGTPGSMFSVQIASDEDVILVPEEVVKVLDEYGFPK